MHLKALPFFLIFAELLVFQEQSAILCETFFARVIKLSNDALVRFAEGVESGEGPEVLSSATDDLKLELNLGKDILPRWQVHEFSESRLRWHISRGKLRLGWMIVVIAGLATGYVLFSFVLILGNPPKAMELAN